MENEEVRPNQMEIPRNTSRLVDLVGPSTTASTFTVNFDSNWTTNNRYVTTIDPYEVQIERIDSAMPIQAGAGILEQTAHTSTYRTLTYDSLQDAIHTLDSRVNTEYQPTFVGYGAIPSNMTTSYTTNGNMVTYTVKVPQLQDIKEEPYYNFLDNIILTRD